MKKCIRYSSDISAVNNDRYAYMATILGSPIIVRLKSQFTNETYSRPIMLRPYTRNGMQLLVKVYYRIPFIPSEIMLQEVHG